MANKNDSLTAPTTSFFDTAPKNYKKAITLYNEGIKKGDKAIFLEALKFLEEALSGYEAKKDPKSCALTNSTMASCYRELKEYEKAKKYCNDAIKKYETCGFDKSSEEIGDVKKKLESIENRISEDKDIDPVLKN